MTKRTQYTKEFKQDAVRLVADHGYKCTEADRNPGNIASISNRWVQEYRSGEQEAPWGNGRRTAEQE